MYGSEEAPNNPELIRPRPPRQRQRKRRHSQTMHMVAGSSNEAPSNTREPSTAYNERAVKILDNLVVPEAILRTMARGQSFNHPKDKLSQMANIAKDLKETKEYLKHNPDIIITTADKGNISIIHKRETFISYRTAHMNANLSNGTYTIIADKDRNHLKSIVEKRFSEVINEIGNEIGLVNASADEILGKLGCPLSVQDRVFVPGRLFGKLKIHKDVIGYRPIVDIGQVRLGRPLEEFMQRILSAILQRNNKYNIKNTLEFILKLKEKFSNHLSLPREHVMMKIDFENMFTNVPTEKALEIIKKIWNEYFAEQPTEETIKFSGETACKVIEFFIKEGCGYFTSDGVLYKQEKGLVMGASLAANVAAILINDTILKVKVYEKTFIAVYADDIVIIADPIDVGRVMQNFSQRLPEMPYRLERECNEKRYSKRCKHPILTLRYLEVLLSRRGEKHPNLLSSKWDYETYHSRGTLNYNSHDSFYTKKGIVISMLVKAITYTTTKALMEEALKLWTEILQVNEYPIVFMKTVALEYIDKKLTEWTTTERHAYVWARKFLIQLSKKQCKNGNKFPKRDIRNISIYRDVPGYWQNDREQDNNTLESTVFTKIKDILLPEYMFNKIVTWKCDVHVCREKFIAKIEHASLKATIIEIVQNPSSAYYKHVVEAHSSISPAYPKNFRYMTRFNESNELNSLMQIEIAANPQLIVVNTDEKALVSQQLNAARPSGEALIHEDDNIAGPSQKKAKTH